MHIYAYLCIFCCLPSLHKGIHNGGPAAEGRRPTIVEAAEGRLLYGGWLSGDKWDIGQCRDKKTLF